MISLAATLKTPRAKRIKRNIMFLKNAFRISINNIGLSFKTILYRLVVTVIAIVAVYFVCVGPLSVIVESGEFKAFMEDCQEILQSIINGSFSQINGVKESFDALVALIVSNASSIRLSLILVAVILLIRSYLEGICNYTVCVAVSDYMSSISRTPFLRALIANIAKSAVFEVIYLIAKVIVLAIAITLAVLCIVYTSSFLSVLSVIIAFWIVVLAVALFLSFTVTVRPSVVLGRKINEAFNFKTDAKTNAGVFASYVFSIVIAVAVNVGVLYTTFAAGLVVTLPATFVYFVCLQCVVFCSVDGRKYFVDYDNIVTPKKLRKEDDRLLTDVDI